MKSLAGGGSLICTSRACQTCYQHLCKSFTPWPHIALVSLAFNHWQIPSASIYAQAAVHQA